MASLQKTFTYEGNATAAPFPAITLNFTVPTFGYATTLVDGKPFILRSPTGKEIIPLSRKLSEKTYDLALRNEFFTGATDNSILNFLGFLLRIGFSNKSSDLLADLSADIEVKISSEDGSIVGHSVIEVLYGLSMSSDKFRALTDRQRAFTNLSVATGETSDEQKQELISYTRKNIFLLNRSVFNDAASQFHVLEPELNDNALLYIIEHVTDVSSGKPRLKINQDEFKTFLKERFSIDKVERVKAIVQLLKENLYDFPVSVPEIKSIPIKGTFTIMAGGTAVSLSDFNFYTLSISYGLQRNDGIIVPASSTFDWHSLSPSQLSNNSVPFDFGVLVTNRVSGDIDVRVNAFDGSVAWQNTYAVSNTDLQDLEIEVSLQKPVVLNPSSETQPGAESNKKLTGKIVEMSGDCKLGNVTVVIQAKKENDTMWRIVGAATTDASGNFSLPYPYGVYIAAQAIVSLTPDSPANIPVNTDAAHVAANETIADNFLYLLVQGADCQAGDEIEDDCECHEGKKSNRLPDQQELIVSDSYTQDIGGSCINLSVPNRTLNEYSHSAVVRTSDPDVANYVLTKDDNGNFRLEGGVQKIERQPIDLSNPVFWQDAPDDRNNLSLYQSVRVATGHILHYKVVTKADGYSMGELLYSLPLAPGQKKEIVMFEQTHTLQGSETQRVSQRESLAASLVNDVDITDTIAGSLSEDTSGSSSATTGGVSGGFGLGAIIDAVGISLGVSGGVANSNSNASQSSNRSLSEYFHERMRNAITQNAQSYRELNATVITTVKEGQQYGVTSEVIANHNHCHSLTIMYFEVLKHYAIFQELSHVEECLFIPLLMTDFTRENVYKWRDVLAKHLLPMPSETYLQPYVLVKSGRQHPLLRGFDAIERIRTNYANVDFPTGAYDDEVINFISGEMFLQTNLPRPKTKYDRIKSWPVVKSSSWSWSGALIGGVLGGPLGFVAGGYLAADGSLKPEAQSVIDDYMSVDANFASVPPAQCIRIKKIDENFFESGGLDKAQWMAYGRLLGKTNMDQVKDWLGYYFRDRLISEWDSIFYNDIAPALFEAIIRRISIGGFAAFDFASERKYKGGEALMRLNIRGTGSNKKRNQITEISLLFDNSANLTNDLVTLNVKNLSLRYSTSHYNGILYSGFINNDLYDDVEHIPAPENAAEKRNPRREDAFIAQRLIEHLNSNLEHYNKWLWRELDKDRLYMLLDGFSIETYNDFGQPVAMRSLASVVKNQLIGIAGNALIMPVAPGYKVDRSYIVEQPIEGPVQEINLLDLYKPLTPVPPYRISIPSKGVFAEAVQGACDACEKVKENTSQDWDKFKPDEPTSINPVTVPVPAVTDWKAAFKDLATPIVNIQNAPAAASPGAGLAASGISELLGKSDVFRDITGLTENQKNAMQTYLSNQENAKAFAEMAKTMAMQGHNTEHSDKIADAIRNSPELSKEEKAQLLKDHFGQMVDGGQTKKAEQDTQKNKPSLTDAAVKAADQGKPVKASSTDGQGKSETVEIGAGNTNNFRVNGTVPLILQGDKSNACWAAAAAMMKSWKDNKTYTIEQVLALVPPEFLSRYNNNQVLIASEKAIFVEALRMKTEPAASYTFQAYIDWMRDYGPVWVTVDSDDSPALSPHANILIGYDGDGTPENSQLVFLDPSTNGEQKKSFADFVKQFESMVTDNPTQELFMQIVHFEEKIVGEGKSPTPPTPSQADFRSRIDTYLDDANAEYTLSGGSTVKARHGFMYGYVINSGAKTVDQLTAAIRAKLGNAAYKALVKSDKAFIARAFYGRARPSEVKTITQALIDSQVTDAAAGISPFTGTTADEIRALQRQFFIGIDCAGYTQLSFFNAVYGHDSDTADLRLAIGFEAKRGSERLESLGKPHFDAVDKKDARTGDLMVMKPRAADSDHSMHTVIVVERTKSGDVHSFLVDASWGNDAYGSKHGGVGRRTLCWDEVKDEWFDISPETGNKVSGYILNGGSMEASENTADPNYVSTAKVGPYLGHTLQGVYRKR